MQESRKTKAQLLEDNAALRRRIAELESQQGTPQAVIGITAQASAERKHTEQTLRERVKELTCLYGISHLIETMGDSLETVLQGIVELMPPAWQHPEIACARIVLDEHKYCTPGFKETPWRQVRAIHAHHQPAGMVEVCYREPGPMDSQPVFLQEEEKLLEVIAERLGRVIERQQAEEQVRAAKDYFELLFNLSPDAAQVMRLHDGCIVDINQGVRAMTGFTREDMIGKSTLDVDLWDNPDDRQTVISELRKQGHCDNYEVVFKRKDGSRFPCLLSARLFTYQGEPHAITITRDISARKQSEEALRESEFRLLQAQRIGQIGSWEWIPAENKVSWSAEMYAIFGLSPENTPLTAELAIQAFHPEDRARIAEATRKTLAEGQPQPVEARVLRPDGSIRYVLGQGEVILDDEGRIVKMRGVYQDVTERRQMEDALRSSETRYRALFESLDAAVLIMRGDICIDCNPATLRLFGLDRREEFIGKTPLDFAPPVQPNGRSSAELVRENVELALQHGAHLFEWQSTRSNGELFWMEVSFSPLFLEDEPLFQCVAWDITGRKQMEAALRRREDELNRAQAVAHIGSWVNELTTNDLTWSDETYRMFGLPLGMPVNYAIFIECVHPDDRTNLERAWETALARREPFDLEHRILVDGAVRWVRERAEIEYSQTGAPLRGIGTVQDITERKHIADALRASEQRLGLALEAARAGAWDWDSRTNQAVWSDSNYRVLGYEPGSVEARYENWLKAVHPDDRDTASAQVAQASEQRRDLDLEYRAVWPDGSVHWLRDVGRLVYDDHNQPCGMRGLQIDITESKKLAETLAASEERYRLLAQNLPDTSVFLFDRDLRYTLVEGEILPQFGFSKEQMLGRSLWEVLPRERAERLAVLYQAALNGAPQTDIPSEYQGRHFDVSILPIRNRQGEIVSGMLISQDITKRWRAEERLRDSEERFRSVIEQASEAIALFNEESVCVEVNAALVRLTGVAREEWLGLATWEVNLRFLPPAQRTSEAAARFKAVAQALAAGQAAQFSGPYEFSVYRPDGEIRSVRMTVFPIHTARGAMVGSILIDITERKRMEEALHQTMASLQATFEAFPDLFFRLQADGVILDCQTGATAELFVSPEVFLGQPVQAILPPPIGLQIGEKVRQALAEPGIQILEYSLPMPVGEQHYEARLVPIAGEQVVAVVRNITGRKQAEEQIRRLNRELEQRVVERTQELQRANEALRHFNAEQTALYKIALALNAQLEVPQLLHSIVEQAAGLLDVAAGGVYLHDGQRDVLVLAVGLGFYAEYIGVELQPGEGLSGRAFQQRTILILDDYQAWDGRAEAFRNERRGGPVIAAALLGRRAPLGALFVVGEQRKRQFDIHDALLVELLTAQAAIALENAQLYERQQAQYRYLQDAQARLIQTEKMSALGRLVASIAHEINNPLQAVQGCLTLLREDVADETPRLDSLHAARWLQDVDVASDEVQRIAAIVQRLRDFYRPIRPGVQATDVAALIDSVLALVGKQLQHSGIAVTSTALAEPPLVIKTSADQLKQVFLNLVLNAIDAMPGGGRLSVAATPDTLRLGDHTQAAVRIDFADTGQGISADHLTRVFEPFFTTKENGSGLGLSISYELITALGGEISVVSEMGVGTTFTIRLPLEAHHETGSAA